MDVQHKLAAILSADVVGYSRLMAEDEDATVRTLSAYRAEIGLLVEQHSGRVVDFTGDNLLAEFPTALAAVRGAVSIQRVLSARNADLDEAHRMDFRIGLHMGDVRVEGGRIYGDGVNIAARLEGLAEPGGICISATVHEQVRNKLEVGYQDLGDQSIKNIPDQVHVFRVSLDSRPARSPGTLRGSRRRVAAFVLVVVVAAGAGLIWRFLAAPATTPTGDVPSLVVLPFANLSDDPEQEYFSDGLTEDLITDLSKISGLLVIARNSAFTYKGRAVRVEDVGRELGVAYVLEGSVRRADDRVRITAQLVETAKGYHLWSERYDRDLQDIFALQDEVAREIVGALEVQLSDSETAQVEHLPTTNLEAYEAFQRGVVYARRLDPDTNLRAQELARRAIELDPEFGPAHALLGSLLMASWINQTSEDPGTMERAERLVGRALELYAADPRSLVAASSIYSMRGRMDDATAAAKQAVALAPGSAQAHAALGNALLRVGKPGEAMRALTTGLRLDPLDPMAAFQMAAALILENKQERVIAVLRRAITHTPDFVPLHGLLTVCYVELGRMAEARTAQAEIQRITPDFSYHELESRNLAGGGPEYRSRVAAALRKLGLQSQEAE